MSDREVDNILLDLESEDVSLRTQAIHAASKLGERAVPCLAMLRKIAAQDRPEVAFLAKKCLYVLQKSTSAGAGSSPAGATSAAGKLAATQSPRSASVGSRSAQPCIVPRCP